jgi:hypothetical protein
VARWCECGEGCLRAQKRWWQGERRHWRGGGRRGARRGAADLHGYVQRRGCMVAAQCSVGDGTAWMRGGNSVQAAAQRARESGTTVRFGEGEVKKKPTGGSHRTTR